MQQPIRRDDRGDAVADVQARLIALGFHIEARDADDRTYADSTEQAVREFQQERGLLVDGVVGPDTWAELVEAGYSLGDRVLYLRRPPFRGDDTRALQRRLNVLGFDPGREDGIFGEQTARAVHEFQKNVGIAADGIAGPTTIDALDRLLAAPVTRHGRTTVRESVGLSDAGGSLEGRTVAIDPGHGPGDPGVEGPSGLREADVAFDLASRLAAELERRGADPVLLRERAEDADVAERAELANDAEADVLLSIHLNGHDDPGAEGSSSYYYGRLGTSSVAGHALAELLQDEITAATGLRNGRAHPKAFPILRETRMPAVQVEPCFLTNPKEERLLAEEPFLTEVVAAMVTAIERFFVGRRLAEEAG